MPQQPPISEKEIKEPRLLKARLDSLTSNIYALLERVEKIEMRGAGSGSGSALTPEQARILEAIDIGSTANPVPAQRAVVSTVSALPPVTTSTEGEIVRLSTDGKLYIFDGSEWDDMVASASAHGPQHLNSGADPIGSGLLDANARVGVRLNSGGTTWTRRRINIVAGDGVGLSAADDAANEEVDVTVSVDSASATSVRVTQSAAQSVSDVTWTTLDFDTESWDDGGFHSNVTNNSRLAAPVTGTYLVIGMVDFAAATGGAERQTRIIVNGSASDIVGETDATHINSGAKDTIVQAAGIWKLNSGDYVELQARHDSGGALNTTSVFMAVLQTGVQ